MAVKKKQVKESTVALLANAESIQECPDLYSNHVQMTITKTEFTMDFFNLRPDIKNPTEIKPIHLQRIILSLNTAKGLATAIANLVDTFEEDTGIKLYNLREKVEEDKVEIWKEQSTDQEAEEQAQEESSQ